MNQQIMKESKYANQEYWDTQDKIKKAVLEERQKVHQELSTIKRWVATIQGVDEYVIRDKDLKDMKGK